VGNAPLHYLARKLLGRDNRITYLYGARSRDYIYLREQYRASCERFIMVTDDGSEGERGYVTGACARLLETESFDFIYTCGPSAMMKELMRVLAGVETPVEVSLENYFGCGVGLCSGCSVETVSGNRRACVDGPVMDGRIIKWESPA
jgi:dihydroorotate dehydrogenase electron transfer subunit